MKVIIAGSRSINDYELVSLVIAFSGFDITEVVSGGAKGVDLLGERWAKHYAIPIKQFLADWDNISHPNVVVRTRRDGTKYDALAGHKRNAEMAKYVGKGGGLVLVHNGSAGSLNMKKTAIKYGLSIYEKVLT